MGSPWVHARFDSTLGFPGEGPRSKPSRCLRDWKLVYVNVTAWASLMDELKRDIGLLAAADVICIQEHHIVGDDRLGKAQQEARRAGWIFEGTSAVRAVGAVSGKEGSKAGVGFL